MPPSHYPLSPESELKASLVGRSIRDPAISAPSLVLDRAKVQRNCAAMLDVCRALDVGFRAHVKSHKTLQLAKLQVGGATEEKKDGLPANFIVSTVMEAEQLIGYVKECLNMGRQASILYGVPPAPSSIPRLLSLASNLPPGTINIILDNLTSFEKFLSVAASSSPSNPTSPTHNIGIFIKIDTGYHRAGIHHSSPHYLPLVTAISQTAGPLFKGLYSHYGHSYAGSSPSEAATGLIYELTSLETAAGLIPAASTTSPAPSSPPAGKLVLTVGATPTATAAQTLLQQSSSPAGQSFRNLLARLKQTYSLELHAGVYPLLDLQQVATRARPSSPIPSPSSGLETTLPPLSIDAISLTLLAEVASAYPASPALRGTAAPERLISAGSLALGREPCQGYPGWGIVADALANAGRAVYDHTAAVAASVDGQGKGEPRQGWIVSKVSQEHGILRYEGGTEVSGAEGEDGKVGQEGLDIGDRILIYPNHACVAGSGFGWYLVVDSSGSGSGSGDGEGEGKAGEVVVDVWGRWRGW